MEDALTKLQELKDQMDRGTPVSREQLDRLGDIMQSPKPAAPDHVADPPAGEPAQSEAPTREPETAGDPSYAPPGGMAPV